MENLDIKAMPVSGAATGADRYNIFGVSITHKGQLAMRGTTTDKYAARLRVFARDGDTKIVMFDLGRSMHKSAAARVLLGAARFREDCVAKGHDWAAVEQFLQRVSGAAAAVKALTLDEQTEQPKAPQLEDAVQTAAVQEEVVQTAVQEEVVQTAAVADTTELLEQQEAVDAGEEPEESVEASRKARKRR